MTRPAPVLVIALISALVGSIVLSSSLNGTWFNNFLPNSNSLGPDDGGIVPLANALKKDLALDISPGLHPAKFAGPAGDKIKVESHYMDTEEPLQCEECDKIAIPNVFDLSSAAKNQSIAAVAFSNQGVFDFATAKKATFFVFSDEPGVKMRFIAVGNDISNSNIVKSENTSKPSAASSSLLFKDQTFSVISNDVSLKPKWNYFEMSVQGAPGLDNVKYPFGFEFKGGHNSITTIYVKGIKYSDAAPLDKYLLPVSHQ